MILPDVNVLLYAYRPDAAATSDTNAGLERKSMGPVRDVSASSRCRRPYRDKPARLRSPDSAAGPLEIRQRVVAPSQLPDVSSLECAIGASSPTCAEPRMRAQSRAGRMVSPRLAIEVGLPSGYADRDTRSFPSCAGGPVLASQLKKCSDRTACSTGRGLGNTETIRSLTVAAPKQHTGASVKQKTRNICNHRLIGNAGRSARYLQPAPKRYTHKVC